MFALPCMGYCFQSFGIYHDASCTHTLKGACRVSHRLMASYQIQCSMGSTYTTHWIHCLLAQPVQPCSNVTVWTTLCPRVDFNCTGSLAVPQMWIWPGCQCLLQHAVLQAAKPLQGLISSNYNAWQTCNVLADFVTVLCVALDWLRKASAISWAAPEACSTVKATLLH